MSVTAPKIFRVTVEVADLEAATAFYADLLGTPGRRHPGARHYFDCGGVLLAVLDVTEGGMRPTPGPKSIYFAVQDIDEVHTRAKSLDTLAPFQIHGQPASDVVERPWGERSFYVTDPWGNELCFVQEGTLYT
jgi:catechol 2,3-dioxygenase-like lactoylglutathione lyase family enzyme